MRYELSLEADNDLENIFDYTYNEFGANQAIRYVSSFDVTFEQLCMNPLSGISRNEIQLNLRSFAKEKHIVFYRIMKDKIRIVRVLHGSMDLPKYFIVD